MLTTPGLFASGSGPWAFAIVMVELLQASG